MTPSIGIHYGIPFEEYAKWEGCSNSALTDLRQSPAHCHYRKTHPEPPTAALILGSAVDTLVFEPKEFNARFAVAEQCETTTQNKVECSRTGVHKVKDPKPGFSGWYCEQHWQSAVKLLRDTEKYEAMITRLTPEQGITAFAIAQAVFAHPAASRLLAEMEQAQASILWESDGLLCKGRSDGLCPSIRTVLDLKTTIDASPEAFERSIFSFGYHRQGAFYLQGMFMSAWEEEKSSISSELVKYDTFAIIAVEKEPPYCVAVYELKEEALQLGRRELSVLTSIYKRCKETGVWPGYSDEPTLIGVPRYAEFQVNQWMER